MAAVDLLKLRRELTDKKMLLCFNGPFSHGLIEELGTAIRRYLESESGKGAAADAFAVCIELSQNIKNYLSRKGFTHGERGNGTLLISRVGDRYAVTAGNVVEDGDARALAARLDELAGADGAELKRRFKERLRQGPSQGGGAGVGLIDVARRSTSGIQYALAPVEAGYTFFSITATV